MMKRFLALLFIINIFTSPSFALIEDDFVNRTLDKNLKIKPYQAKMVTNETPVQVRIKDFFTTKTKPEEGSYIEFETVENVKSYPAGTTVRGRIETVSMNFTSGVPADVVIGSFEIDGKPLYGEIKAEGANRTLWLRPCMAAGSIFFGAGLALMPIRGGHAKIKQKEIYTLYMR